MSGDSVRDALLVVVLVVCFILVGIVETTTLVL